MMLLLGFRGRSLGAALAVSLLALAAPAHAQSKIPAPIIAVVDMDQVLAISTAAKGAREQREKYAQTYQNDLTKRESQLDAQEQELARQRSVLTAEAFAEKVKGFEQQVAEVRRNVLARRRALDTSYSTSMGKITEQLLKLTAEIAQQNGANVVLAKQQVVLLDPQMEITQAVAESLNKTLASVDFPAPKEEPLPNSSASQSSGHSSAKGKK